MEETNNFNPLSPELVTNTNEESTPETSVEETKESLPEDFNEEEIRTQIDAEFTANNDDDEKIREMVWNACIKLHTDKIPYNVKDVYEIIKDYYSHTKIELMHDKVTLDNQKAAVEFIDSAIISSEGLAGASSSLQSLADGSFFDNLMNDGTTDDDKIAISTITDFTANMKINNDDDDQIEIKKLQKELHESVAIADVAYNLVMANYKAVHGDSTVYDDVLEKLYKDKDTLSKSSNPNAGTRIKNIDTVIEALDESKRLELIDYIKPKLTNLKATREMAKELIRIGPKIYPKLNSVGIPKEYVLEFLRFFLTEHEFRSIYYTGDLYVQEKEVIPQMCMMFFYHILKLVEHERHRGTYKSVIYKMIFIYVMDTSMKYPVKKSEFRAKRFVEQDGDPVTETELSKIRSDIYDAIMPVLKIYTDVLNDKTLMNYAKSQARRSK